MSNDFILNAAIWITFATKMRGILTDLDPSISETRKNVNLISNTVTKHCILFGIALVMNQGFYVVGIYGDLANAYDSYAWYAFLLYSIRALENIVNVVVLWLILRVNYGKYIGLCGYCHNCVAKCCFKNIDSKIVSENPYIEWDSMGDESNDPVLN